MTKLYRRTTVAAQPPFTRGDSQVGLGRFSYTTSRDTILWRIEACQDILEQASLHFNNTGGWIEGWIAFRATLRFDGKSMPDAMRTRLLSIIDRLKPVDLVERARAFVLNHVSGGYYIVDGEDDTDEVDARTRASQTAVKIGAELAVDRERLAIFLPEAARQNRDGCVHQFGRGLAQGAEDLDALWADLVSAYRTVPEDERTPAVLGGFLAEARRLSPGFCASVLDQTLDDPDLGRKLPYLQAQAGLDADGLERLEAAARRQGILQADDFRFLTSGAILDVPAEPLTALLETVARLDGGVAVTIDILYTFLYIKRAKMQEKGVKGNLLLLGRNLLNRVDWAGVDDMRDYELGQLISVVLAGSEAAEEARSLCMNIQNAAEEYWPSVHRIGNALTALFKVQPFVALDCFAPDGEYFCTARELDAETLCAWADKAPAERYPQLGRVLSLFPQEHGEEVNALSPLFLAVMAKAPDKYHFLAADWRRLHPSTWRGSLADILEKRKTLLDELAAAPDPAVQAWVDEQKRGLDQYIAEERKREKQKEERFE